MQKLLLILSLSLSICTTITASHNFGGEIWYTYIGDSTGKPNHYMVNMRLYSDQVLASSYYISINSSCFSTQLISLQQTAPKGYLQDSTGGYYLPEMRICNDDSVPNFSYNLIVNHFQDTVTLPSACSDITFSYQNCCMPSNIDNLSASGHVFTLEATLNNTLGSNSSPMFTTAPINKFCNYIKQSVSHKAVESNQDSLYYRSIDLLNYSPGYSSLQPMKTVNGFNLSSKSGALTFTPSQTQVSALYFAVEEYRYDASLGMWFKIGQSTRSIIYNTGNCKNLGDWALSKSNTGIDTLVEAKCGDQTITLKLNYPYIPSSLAADGSDFFILDSQGTPIPVIAASAVVNSAGQLPQKINLSLNAPINDNDTYRLMSKVGSDLNTIVNICGYPLVSKDTTRFIVNDCNIKVGLDDKPFQLFKTYPSPANNYLFVEFENDQAKYDLVIHNNLGLQIQSHTIIDYRNKIDISSLPVGVYFLTITTERGKTSTQKFVKK